MGCRGNIVVSQNSGNGSEKVLLYTHWKGDRLPEIVQETLRKRAWWDDECYLARMLFSTMIKDSIDSSSGFGISTYLTDNEYPILEVNTERQCVLRINADDLREVNSWTFEEFINLNLDKNDPWNSLQ